jgi:hypothetical protein
MMKSKVTAKKDNFCTSDNNLLDSEGRKKKEPSAGLMQRLATGQKTTLNKKEMKELTIKNYENLPEIKKKKEEEKKREELKMRQ